MKKIIIIIIYTTDIMLISYTFSIYLSMKETESIIEKNISSEEKMINETSMPQTDGITDHNSETNAPATKLESPLQTYTIETLPSTIELDVPTILQNPELPTGCEITSLTILLNYLGYPMDKTDLAKNYLEYTYSTSLTFSDAFIGNPFHNDGYGCFVPVIMKTGAKFLKEKNSPIEMKDLSQKDFNELLVNVANKHPVIVTQ